MIICQNHVHNNYYIYDCIVNVTVYVAHMHNSFTPLVYYILSTVWWYVAMHIDIVVALAMATLHEYPLGH